MIRRYPYEFLLVVATGVFVRILLSPHFNDRDYFFFLLPWFKFVSQHGVEALAHNFTDYAPFYTYLLVIAAEFKAWASPLVLIKAISLVFEIGSAFAAAAIVHHSFETPAPGRSLAAFAAVWLAPDVLYNGPAWGQADSIWTCFVLLAILQIVRARVVSGVLAFGMAFAMKAQAAFLGPFVLGVLWRGGTLPGKLGRTLWLGVVPIIYLIVAVPVVLAGRPFAEVALTYGAQADKYHFLSSNAGSIWILVPWFPYHIGVIVGLAAGCLASLALALVIARSQRRDAEYLVHAAAASLLMLPYVLPMMHDRYFFAFEVVALVLACVNPRFLAVAVIAQVNCLLVYVAYDFRVGFGVRIAAISNGILLFFVLRELLRPRAAAIFARADWARYGIAVAATAIFLALSAGFAETPALKIASTVVFGGSLGLATFLLLRASFGNASGARGLDRASPLEEQRGKPA